MLLERLSATTGLVESADELMDGARLLAAFIGRLEAADPAIAVSVAIALDGHGLVLISAGADGRDLNRCQFRNGTGPGPASWATGRRRRWLASDDGAVLDAEMRGRGYRSAIADPIPLDDLLDNGVEPVGTERGESLAIVTMWCRDDDADGLDAHALTDLAELVEATACQLAVLATAVALEQQLRNGDDIVHQAEGALIEREGISAAEARRRVEQRALRRSTSLTEAARELLGSM